MAKVTTQQAVRERYVLMTARSLSSPGARALLKLGQYIHRKTVPTRRIPSCTHTGLMGLHIQNSSLGAHFFLNAIKLGCVIKFEYGSAMYVNYIIMLSCTLFIDFL